MRIYGPISEEHKQAISTAHKGVKFSEEHKRKISEANKGRTVSEENRLKSSLRMKGKNMGDDNPSKREDVRAKISAALKGRKKTPEQIQKMSEQRRGKPSGRKGEKRRRDLSKIRCGRSYYHVRKMSPTLRIAEYPKPPKQPRSPEAREAQRRKMLGRKVHSEEWKQRLRERLKGNKLNLGKKDSQEVIEKKRKAATGRKQPNRKRNSEEQNKKIGLSKLGKKRAPFSKEWLENISKSHIGINRGDKSASWKGGVTDLRHLIRSSYKYYDWRTACFQRDDFTCEDCGQRGGKLQVHHHPKSFKDIFHEHGFKTLEDAYGCDELWDINNGVTLCIGCHTKTETWGKPSKKEI